MPGHPGGFDLGTPTDVKMRIAPVDGKAGMYRLVPSAAIDSAVVVVYGATIASGKAFFDLMFIGRDLPAYRATIAAEIQSARALEADKTRELAVQLRQALSGSAWKGAIGANAAVLSFDTASEGTVVYQGVREQLTVVVADDARVVLSGVDYEPADPRRPVRSFALDTFVGFPTLDLRMLSGSYTDAGGRSGRWSASRVTDDERRQMEQADIARVATLRAEEERRLGQEAERQRREERDLAARTPTRTIAVHEFRRPFGNPIRLEVTDANVIVSTRKPIGYWDIERFILQKGITGRDLLSYVPKGGRFPTVLVDGDNASIADVLQQLVDAHRAWSARFPDYLRR